MRNPRGGARYYVDERDPLTSAIPSFPKSSLFSLVREQTRPPKFGSREEFQSCPNSEIISCRPKMLKAPAMPSNNHATIDAAVQCVRNPSALATHFAHCVQACH